MAGGGDNQSLEIKKAVVNIDTALLAVPTSKQFTILACSQYGNERLELLSLDYSARVLPVDAADPTTVTVSWVDDSAVDAETALKTDFDLKAAGGGVAKVARNIWSGSQILDEGDTVNAVVTSTTPTTASEGAAIVATYRVLKHS